MVGWFLGAAALGAVGYYVVRPVVLEANNTPSKVSPADDGGEVLSKKFSAPKVTVSEREARLRRGGSTIGKRPRRVKKKVETTEAPVTAPDSGGAPPSIPDAAGPPIANPTTSPIDGGTGIASGGQ